MGVGWNFCVNYANTFFKGGMAATHVGAVSHDKSGLASRLEVSFRQRVFHMPCRFRQRDVILLILHLVRAVCERYRRAGRTLM
jgi:hypothetical protein